MQTTFCSLMERGDDELLELFMSDYISAIESLNGPPSYPGYVYPSSCIPVYKSTSFLSQPVFNISSLNIPPGWKLLDLDIKRSKSKVKSGALFRFNNEDKYFFNVPKGHQIEIKLITKIGRIFAYVKQDIPPTTENFDQRTAGTTSKLTLKEGNWFLLLNRGNWTLNSIYSLILTPLHLK